MDTFISYECKGTYIGGYPQMADDYDNITYPLTELGWELGEEINPVMYTAQEWEKYRNTPFHEYINFVKSRVSIALTFYLVI